MFAPYIIKAASSLVDEGRNISSFWVGSNPSIDIRGTSGGQNIGPKSDKSSKYQRNQRKMVDNSSNRLSVEDILSTSLDNINDILADINDILFLGCYSAEFWGFHVSHMMIQEGESY